ncbi:hypothetical protein [Actinoplanes sp. TBRC 11911]|uniref:hypothetical protein n=1 Tax=Actinoplanes sp. TBRC 11911 TaxID=2729386 RepID=UPI0028968735|nr:hypothetical protein [Actinoplanes sp. TBRC 11911]
MTAVAAALLVSTSLLMARVQSQVRTIGDVAAPQAATAADLYFALSDMDASAARMVLTGDNDALAGTQADALGTYQQRSDQVDADLQKSLTTATGAESRAIVLELLGHLAVYRERVWQTLTAGDAAPGYYTQATNVLHLDLLPAAQRLKNASEGQLAEAYAGKRLTQGWATGLAVVLGVVLAALLIGLQVWLARRFRRVLNPALLLATVLVVALLVPLTTVLSLQARWLGAARDDSLTPFLALSQARAISYDAAADTSRYLISDNLAYYEQDFATKSGCLGKGGGCGTGGGSITGGLSAVAGGSDVSPDAAGQVVSRWSAYERDHKAIVALARQGRDAAAIDQLTGIRRGAAAFDFSYYDAAVARIADDRKAAFDDAMDDTETLLTGWAVIPLVVLGLVMLLVLVGVRRRLAEYR